MQTFRNAPMQLNIKLLVTAFFIAYSKLSIAQPQFEAHPVWKANRGKQQIVLIGEVHGKPVPEVDAKLAIGLFNDREIWIEGRPSDSQIAQQVMRTYVYQPTKSQADKLTFKLISKYGSDASALVTRTFQFPAILSLLMIHGLTYRPVSLDGIKHDYSRSLTALASKEFEHKVKLLDSVDVWVQAAASCGNDGDAGQMLDAILNGETQVLGKAYVDFQNNWDRRLFRAAVAGESARFFFDPFVRHYYKCYVETVQKPPI
jgi:hypothetical protein